MLRDYSLVISTGVSLGFIVHQNLQNDSSVEHSTHIIRHCKSSYRLRKTCMLTVFLRKLTFNIYKISVNIPKLQLRPLGHIFRDQYAGLPARINTSKDLSKLAH